MSNTAKNFKIFATSLNILHNYFDTKLTKFNKITFLICVQQNFRSSTESFFFFGVQT